MEKVGKGVVHARGIGKGPGRGGVQKGGRGQVIKVDSEDYRIERATDESENSELDQIVKGDQG